MYKIEWSKDNKNLPILNDFAQDNIIPPRPVFFEELDLLGFNKYFKYHSSEEPLMWAIGRDYYYNSEKVARAVGGDINNAPVLEIYQDSIILQPIDIDMLIKINKSKIEVLKNEAIEFTKKVYNKKEYLENGNWKKRAGGNSIETMNNIEIYDQENKLEIFMDNSNENFFEWLKVLGNYKTDTQKNNVRINIDDHNILNIKYDKHSNKEKITTSSSNIIDLSHLKKIAYKANYCVHCGSCEAECPTGALNVFPKVNIDTTLCIHCSKCLDFHNKGCVMADSAHKTVVGEGKGNNDIKGFNDYGDFGLRQEWLTSFFNNGFNWVVENELGTKQKISIKKWFRDAELVDSKVKMTTPFFMLLQKNSLSDNHKYQLILINLYHNSSLLKWYIDNIPVNNSLNTNELAILAKEYTGLAETTIKHSINSLVNLFDTTPLGEELKIGFITKEKNIRTLEKIGTDNVSNEAILYSLYKLKETKSRDNFRVSEFYDEGFEGGPYKIFGINKDVLTQKLRFISEETKLIDVDLNQGLDNIFLKDLSAIEVLKEVLK